MEFFLYLILNKIKSWFFSGINYEGNNIQLQILLINIISTIGFICLIVYSFILKTFSTEIFFELSLIYAFLYFIIPILNKFGLINFSRYFITFLGNSITLFLSIIFDEMSDFHIFFVLQVVVVFLIFKYNI